jgi:integration host factor subunit beta
LIFNPEVFFRHRLPNSETPLPPPHSQHPRHRPTALAVCFRALSKSPTVKRSLRQLHYWFKLFCNLIYRHDIMRNIINPNRIGSLMTKSELIEALAKEQNLPPKDAKKIIETILETIAAAMVRGESVEIRGFGSFQVREYETYTGRNPKTGNQIEVAPKRLPFFKVGKELREQVNASCGSKF